MYNQFEPAQVRAQDEAVEAVVDRYGFDYVIESLMRVCAHRIEEYSQEPQDSITRSWANDYHWTLGHLSSIRFRTIEQ